MLIFAITFCSIMLAQCFVTAETTATRETTCLPTKVAAETIVRNLGRLISSSSIGLEGLALL
ncbi:hypothetical protein AKG11_30210 [Shinella sp. SUS2]|uniref:hypothetical protein n=1 Tax=unclassified Shinella TaxID=2643062 RepID=UPI00067FBB5A|nr:MULTISPECIES: hypothetical protein [unclassified Shinella]KNY13265.1 hypothetical protein AKG11_30210 [Shinella sp. SUS2]KOC72050.1 hypothetical protein AKG10_29445 [Shinella sp. GWS1]